MNSKDTDNPCQVLSWEDIELFFEDIKMMARRMLAKQSEKYSWRPTALVTETLRRIYERNGKWTEVNWEHRGSFFKYCREAMISAINDRHRYEAAVKRPSKADMDSLEDLIQAYSPLPYIRENPEIFIAFKQATDRIAKKNQGFAEVLKYRFFNGLSLKEIAVIMGKSERQMRRIFAESMGELKSIIQDTQDSGSM